MSNEGIHAMTMQSDEGFFGGFQGIRFYLVGTKRQHTGNEKDSGIFTI